MRRIAPLLLLAACAAAPIAPPRPDHTPDPEGIGLAGSPLRIDFGRAEDGVVSAVARLEGDGPASTMSCADGVTALRWPSGLALYFRNGAFLGWAKSDGSAAGIGCST